MLRPDLCDFNDAYIAVKEKIDVNPIQDGPFWDCSWMVGKKVPFPKSIKTSYNDETWQSYVLPKKYQKKQNINHMIHFLSSANISIFSLEISIFSYIKKYGYRWHFDT